MKRRLIALLLCIAMIGSMTVYAVGDDTVCTCGTATEEHAAECALLAEPAPEPETEPETDPVCTCGTATEEHAAECALYVAPAEPTCTCGTATEEHAAECPLYVAPAPVCTCGTTTEEHAAECALYVAPAEPTCTCGTTTEEHATECALYVEPEAPSVADQLLAAASVEDMYMLMLGMMETDMDGLMALTRDEIKQIRARVAELDPESDDTDTQDLLDTLEVLPNGGEAESAYELIAAASSLSEMWAIMSDPANTEGVEAMTDGEIENLLDKTYKLYDAIYDEPTADDAYHYTSILKLLDTLLCPEFSTYPTYNHTWPGNNIDYSIGSTEVYNVTLTNSVNLTGTITVNGKLNITSNGNYNISSTKGTYFVIGSGGTLTITGNNGAKVTINGGSGAAPAIRVDNGTLNLTNVNILNYTNTSNAETVGSRGGAIRFGTESSTTAGGTLTNVTIDGCKAPNGSAIMLAANCSGNVTIKNSTIKNCASVKNDWGGTIRTQGKYNGKLNIESCIIEDNHSNRNGGGIYWNACGTNASLSIKGTASNPTIIRRNSAGTQGGGLHLGGQNITVENTHILNNSAPNGGGISVTPYDDGTTTSAGCSVTLGQGAKLEGNTATTNGGGVYMRIYSADPASGVTFAVTVNEGATIQNNTAANGGAFAVIQETGTKKYNAAVTINGGTICGNKATTGNGGAFYITRNYKTTDAKYTLNVNVAGGQIFNNTAKVNGGAIYLQDGASSAKVTMSNGLVGGSDSAAANKAVNGGAVYIQGGSFNMTNGTMSNNIASANGGAVYVTGGTFDMSNGTISSNSAVNGGGAYVNGGKVTMLGGTMSTNTVTGNGGALYSNGGNFYMISGTLANNTATGATSYGGGAYVTGGSIEIGAQNCGYNNPNGDHNNATNHNDKPHPLISENYAQDSGGGLAVVGSGNITMHCGKIVSNTAPNPGRGQNAYMDNGIFTYKNGNLGVVEGVINPDLVAVGGTFVDGSGKASVKLDYYHCNNGSHTGSHVNALRPMTAHATKDTWINMPDGEKYWDADANFRFFGWTFYGPNDDSAKNFVRAKSDYVALGDPMQVVDNHDSNASDNTISLYALWAPNQSEVSYSSGAMINGEYKEESWANHSDNPDTYDFVVESNVVTFKAPIKAGYKFVGWYIYQNEGQNANWGYEPVYKAGQSGYAGLDYTKLHYLAAEANGTYDLEMGTTLFGNITMIPAFVPAYTDLTIEKAYPAGADYSIDENQTFVFEISGNPSDDDVEFTTMQVVIKGNGKVTIKDIPVGTYTITEVSGWSWRYGTTTSVFGTQTGSNVIRDVKLSDPDESNYTVVFTNTRTEDKWLSGDSYARNLWAIAETVVN